MPHKSGVVACAVSPHPPVVLPEVGGDDAKVVSSTHSALTILSERILQLKPDTIVVVGPHGPIFREAITATGDEFVRGDLRRFGARSASVSFRNDLELLRQIERHSLEQQGVELVALDESGRRRLGAPRELDHGAVVPLRFVYGAGYRGMVANLCMGMLDFPDLYAFGVAIRTAAESLDRRVVVLATADLSHRLTPGAPAGYHRDASKFDAQVLSALESCDPMPLLNMDKNLIENAGECGLRPIIIVMGALDGKQARSEVLSYEAPFGVGYCVCYIEPGEADRDRCLLPRLRAAGVERECSEQSDIVRLARKSLEQYVRSGIRIEPPGDDSWMSKTANACFVSLQKHGRLRGCIGSIEPQNSTLAEEVIENAIAAGTEDPRFMPVTPEELGDLVYSVDVLEPAERVASVSDLDPEVYGVIVEKGKRRGLLLPDLPGITSADEQVRIAREKAGIREAETGVNLYRFRVERYH